MGYVVLHHTGVAADHYDLLIDPAADAQLLTWRCSTWPLKRPTNVNKLPDHRRMYLEYEGPVSGGRGEVKRIAAGNCEIMERSTTNLVVRLQVDEDKQFTLVLTHLDADIWEAVPKAP